MAAGHDVPGGVVVADVPLSVDMKGDYGTAATIVVDVPVEVAVDGRPTCELPPGEDLAVEFGRTRALLAQLPGASFYHRLRERFGRLAR